MEYYVDNFNAIGDGVSNDTEAINNAIMMCNYNGGGKVIFTKNKTYRSGTIILLDDVELYFQDNSTLKASDNLKDFGCKDLNYVNRPTWENCDYNGEPSMYFILGLCCNNIKISGNGIIDGNEEIFYGNVTKYHIEGAFYPRVPLIYLKECNNIEISGVTLTKSAFWTTHLVGSNNIYIHDINIKNNLRLANCDGIDPDACKNVLIERCNIEAADDCIVFKTTKNSKKYGNLENVIVRDCNLTSTSAAIKFGTETVSGFKNINISNINITKSNRGISLQLRDEGYIEDVHFNNIKIDTRRFSTIEWWGKAEPIAITAIKRYDDTNIGYIKNVTFNNISCDSESGVFIYGENNIDNIAFDNINIKISNKTNYEKTLHDIRPCYYGDIFNHNVNPFYIHKANNIKIGSYTFNYDEDLAHICDEGIYNE